MVLRQAAGRQFVFLHLQILSELVMAIDAGTRRQDDASSGANGDVGMGLFNQMRHKFEVVEIYCQMDHAILGDTRQRAKAGIGVTPKLRMRLREFDVLCRPPVAAHCPHATSQAGAHQTHIHNGNRMKCVLLELYWESK